MFLLAPVDIGVRIRVVPWATLLLAALQISMAAWCLPRSARLGTERRAAEVHLQSAACETSPGRLARVRRAALASRVEALAATDPVRAWGFRAGDPLGRAALALFVHADWGHLAANLLGLLVAGALLEQVWGAGPVVPVFLLAGSGALWIDAATGSPGTLVGASAGAAALLGAAFVVFGGRRARFRYVYLDYLRPRVGTFAVACPLLALLWLAQQVSGLAFASGAEGASVAYVAHLAGSALGAGAALVLRSTRAGAGLRRARSTRRWPG